MDDDETGNVDVEKEIVVFLQPIRNVVSYVSGHLDPRGKRYISVEGYRELERKLADRDAQCAAMREALKQVREAVPTWQRMIGGPQTPAVLTSMMKAVHKALSTDAGKGWMPRRECEALLELCNTEWEQKTQDLSAEVAAMRAALVGFSNGMYEDEKDNCFCGGWYDKEKGHLESCKLARKVLSTDAGKKHE